jgi:hypothetical protein
MFYTISLHHCLKVNLIVNFSWCIFQKLGLINCSCIVIMQGYQSNPNQKMTYA